MRRIWNLWESCRNGQVAGEEYTRIKSNRALGAKFFKFSTVFRYRHKSFKKPSQASCSRFPAAILRKIQNGRLPHSFTHIQLGSYAVTPQSTVCNLGVHHDGQLTMKVHVQRICQTSFYQLRQFRSVRRSLSVNACTALVHAFVTSRLDYCNSLLAGIGDGLIDQLQTVLRVAARLVLRKRKFDSISADIRDRLHWLPIRSRIDFKLGLLVYKCLQGTAPGYLTEMLVQKSTVPALSRLRSTARGDLLVPRTKTKTIGPRSFATSGPALWNNLPDDLRDPSLSLTVFKQRLKSYLFKQCWCTIQPKLTFAATFQLMHWHSSVRSFASKEVTFTLHFVANTL